jgi:type II secretory pathway pseudopilin PulG
MAALLVTLAVMSVILGMAMPVWRTVVQREKEEELIFRGRQYARAIQLYQRKFAAAYPASVDVLVEQKFLRKKYKDPMTKSGEFEIVYQGTLAQRQAAMAGRGGPTPGMQPATVPGRAGTAGQVGAPPGSAFGSQVAGPQGGVVGVASKSKEKSLRILDGRSAYNEWQFVFIPAQVPRTGPAGAVGPGGRGATQPGPQRGRGPGGPGSPFSRPPG